MAIFYKISRTFLKGVFAAFYKHEVIYPKDGLHTGAAIIAANHFSFLDPPLVSVSMKEEIYFLAGSYLFKNPLFKKLITSLHAYPVSQSSSDVATFRTICQLLKQGKKVLIFPEGTRSLDGTISPFKKGLGLLAKRSGCPIIPTYIHGTFDAWPKGKKMPSFVGKKTTCIFGSPLFYEEDAIGSKIEHDAIAKKTYDAVIEMQSNYLKSSHTRTVS